MQFTYDGRLFAFRFQYVKEEKRPRVIGEPTPFSKIDLPVFVRTVKHGVRRVGGGPGQWAFISLVETFCHTDCVLFEWLEDKWKATWTGRATCSPKDVFTHKIGREIALGRYMHSNPFAHHRSIPGKDRKHPQWELVDGDPMKGAEFYKAMLAAWHARFKPKEKSAA